MEIVMNHETYENLLRVAEKRRQQAALRGNWADVHATSMEIVLLGKTFKETQNMNEMTRKEGE